MACKKAAGFVIFRRYANTIEYLMLQASYGDHHWTPPKGHVDSGEDDLTTAIRETSEEAGFHKQDLKIYQDAKKCVNYNVKGKPKLVIYWLAELIKPCQEVRLSEEHQNYKWLPYGEAWEIAQYQEMRDVLQFCNNYIEDKLK